MRAILGLVVGGFALSGCALIKTDDGHSPAAATKPAPIENALILGAIAQSQIPKGECGMVLWTLDADRPVPVFRFIAGGSGDIVLNGAPYTLELVSASGEAGFGVSEKSSFTGDGGLSVDVSVEFGSGFENGGYLQRGLIAVASANGWRSVTPAAGIAGCRR